MLKIMLAQSTKAYCQPLQIDNFNRQWFLQHHEINNFLYCVLIHSFIHVFFFSAISSPPPPAAPTPPPPSQVRTCPYTLEAWVLYRSIDQFCL